MKLNRRDMLIGAGGLVAAGAAPALAQPAILRPGDQLLSKGKGPRVVVAGGGWGGLSFARHMHKVAPNVEVVVLERNPIFFSCPMSNKWLIDVIDTNFLVHDMLGPSRAYGYTLVQTEITAFERDKKRVLTAKGSID